MDIDVFYIRRRRRRRRAKDEFDPGSEGRLAICLTHASRTLFSGRRKKRLLAKGRRKEPRLLRKYGF
jgi:hypothetical protein